MNAQIIETVEQGPVYGFEKVMWRPATIVSEQQLQQLPKPRFYEDPGYWQVYEYDPWGRYCFCYGGPNCYSWGWFMDDFGNAVMAYSQNHYGMWDARHHCH
jgi:hypothetical protein